MTIEYRYCVVPENLFPGRSVKWIVGKISGHRKKVCVKVTSTMVTGYRSRMGIKQWDEMARTADEARNQFVGILRNRINRRQRELADLCVQLSDARQQAASYPVRRLS